MGQCENLASSSDLELMASLGLGALRTTALHSSTNRLQILFHLTRLLPVQVRLQPTVQHPAQLEEYSLATTLKEERFCQGADDSTASGAS